MGDITDRYKELVPTPRDGYTRMGVRSHAKGTFLVEVEPGQQIEEQELSKVRANNLIVNIVFAWEHAVAITSEADAKALVSHRFPQFSFHDNMEPGFFRYATLDKDFRHHLWLASPSGAGRNKTLNIGTMLEYEFTLPSRKEQTEIAKLFDQLDNLITLHQRNSTINWSTLHAWEQRKLGELADFSKGHGYSKADLRDEGTPIILYGRLYTNYETVISNVGTFALEREGSVKSLGNEVIVPGSGETAEDISVASAVRQAGILLGGDLNVVRPHEDLDQTFLALAITGASPHDQMAKRAQGKTVVHLHNEDLKEIDIAYPSVDEQTAIGGVFTDLDNLITLHQRRSYTCHASPYGHYYCRALHP